MSEHSSFDDLINTALTFPFSGWDFYVLRNTWKTTEPSWNYPARARAHIQGITSMLDQDTGGDELLSSLAPFPPYTWATERYLTKISIIINHAILNNGPLQVCEHRLLLEARKPA